MGSSEDGRWIIQIRATPLDEFGNYIGPGQKNRISIEMPGYPTDTQIQDELDGSYTRVFTIPPSALGADVKVMVGDETIFERPASKLLRDPKRVVFLYG